MNELVVETKSLLDEILEMKPDFSRGDATDTKIYVIFMRFMEQLGDYSFFLNNHNILNPS